MTEALTESQTESLTESQTESLTEAPTEALTESSTEALIFFSLSIIALTNPWESGEPHQTILEHQEHAPITLPEGIYIVTTQREYTPTEIRNVKD